MEDHQDISTRGSLDCYTIWPTLFYPSRSSEAHYTMKFTALAIVYFQVTTVTSRPVPDCNQKRSLERRNVDGTSLAVGFGVLAACAAGVNSAVTAYNGYAGRRSFNAQVDASNRNVSSFV
jgi:hypothetical protein